MTGGKHLDNALCFLKPSKSKDKSSTVDSAGYNMSPTDNMLMTNNQDSCSVESTDSENKTRGNWGGQMEFLLSCIGYAVGLGNIWRFPYLCMRNGGGAFLIPYFMFLLIGGIPLFFMELIIGQFSSLSPISVWDMCPLFKGLGWAMIVVSGICSVYYNIIITWVIYFLGMSFQWPLPWSKCDNDWNTKNCVERGRHASNYSILINSTNLDTTTPVLFVQNFTGNSTANETQKMTSAEEFWQFNVLEMSDGIENLGGLRWQLVVCHVVGWLLVFLCLVKGIKSSGKVVYVTATVPYIFLTILLIRGCMMPGAIDGIIYYLKPDFGKLLEFRIWTEACLQIFYSLGPAWGGLITMSSYNKFNHNIYKDAIVVPFVNCFTSFFAGFVIFSVIGFMAYEAGLPVEKVITSGPGLAFVAYPEALTQLPGAPIWSVCFFVMLLTIGLDSQFVMFETLVSGIVDEFPQLFRGNKVLVTAGMAMFEMVVGLLFCSRAGMYIFQIVDWYTAFFSVTLIAATECLVIAYLYGMDRLIGDLEMMIGRRVCCGWKILWGGLTPIVMLVCLIYSIVAFDNPKYGDYSYPVWVEVIGWMLSFTSVIHIPAFIIYKMATTGGTFVQRLKSNVRPCASWGPALEKHRKNYEGVAGSDPEAGKPIEMQEKL
ncbi:sodium- and chloride-dependent glycine transporter 1-like [Lineus longissimus]|uniref:sodium- and chloride-dependent glycine transporter 1-like n=1 Tax=Lineus longissimus TaxID=88925 RepID=UPI002B4C7D20